jgi:hypothetical protein
MFRVPCIMHATVMLGRGRKDCFPLPLNAVWSRSPDSVALTTTQDVHVFIALVQVLLGKLRNEEVEEDVKAALQVAESAVSV